MSATNARSRSNAEIINGKEWRIDRHDEVTEAGEYDAYAGAWARAMIENAALERKQPRWIGVSEKSGREAPVDYEKMFRHVFFGGTTGAGKSTALLNLLQQLIYGGEGVCHIDPKGDDVPDLLRRIPKERWDDVVYIAPGDDYLGKHIGFNLFSTYNDPGDPGFDAEVEGIVDDFVSLLAAEDYWGKRMDRITKNMVRAMIRYHQENDVEFTPIEVYYALLDEDSRQEFADLIGDDVTSDDIEFLEAYTDKIANELEDKDIEPLLGRFQDWVENPIPRSIISQREAKISIPEAVDNQKIIIVKNDLEGDAKKMVATAIMRRVWTCVNSRLSYSDQQYMELAGHEIETDQAGEAYTPFFLSIDECDDVLTEASQIQKILTKARSKKLGMILATQTLRSLSEDAQDAILSNCNTLLSLNPRLPKEATVLAKRFGGKDPDDLQKLPDFHAWTRLDSGQDPFMVKLTPPYPPLHTIEESFKLIQRSLSNYGVERKSGTEIREQLHFYKEDAQTKSGEGTELTQQDIQHLLKTAYDLGIELRDDPETSPGNVPLPEPKLRAAVAQTFDIGDTPASHRIEKLTKMELFSENRDDEVGLYYTLTADGKERLGMDTGSAGSGGKGLHRYLLGRMYVLGTQLGLDMDLVSQGGDDALPDAVGYLPDQYDISTATSKSEIVETLEELATEEPTLYRLTDGDPLAIEAESTTHDTQPGQTVRNLLKALHEGQRCLFVVAEGDDEFTGEAQIVDRVLRNNPFTSNQCPADTDIRFYTVGRYSFHDDRVNRTIQPLHPDPDTTLQWVDIDGDIVLRTDDGEVLTQYESREAFLNPSREDFPAYATKKDATADWRVYDGETDNAIGSYSSLEDLRSDTQLVYEPVVPDAEYDDLNRDDYADTSIDNAPYQDRYDIGIVPNDKSEPLSLYMDSDTVVQIPDLEDDDAITTSGQSHDDTTETPDIGIPTNGTRQSDATTTPSKSHTDIGEASDGHQVDAETTSPGHTSNTDAETGGDAPAESEEQTKGKEILERLKQRSDDE